MALACGHEGASNELVWLWRPRNYQQVIQCASDQLLNHDFGKHTDFACKVKLVTYVFTFVELSMTD